jgi:hypothetical protein
MTDETEAAVTNTVEIQAFGDRALVALYVISLDQVTVATAVDGERAVRPYATVLQAVASFNDTAEELAARFGEPAELLDPFEVCLNVARREHAPAA